MPASNVMGEYAGGILHSGSKAGPLVTNPKQAIAIKINEAKKTQPLAGFKIPQNRDMLSGEKKFQQKRRTKNMTK